MPLALQPPTASQPPLASQPRASQLPASQLPSSRLPFWQTQVQQLVVSKQPHRIPPSRALKPQLASKHLMVLLQLALVPHCWKAMSLPPALPNYMAMASQRPVLGLMASQWWEPQCPI
jgi:hypothetical protein